MSRWKLLGEMLGETVISIPAKMVIARASGGVEVDGMKQIIFGGSGYTDFEKFCGEHFELLECEMLIIPKSMSRSKDGGEFKGMRLGDILVRGFADRNNWEETEELE